MYKKIEDDRRLTDNEASEIYPDSFILMHRESMYGEFGVALYIADNMGELIDLALAESDVLCGIVEGLNYKRSLGGVVVSG